MYIYKSNEIRRIDSEAEKRGMSGFTLMELAGAGLFKAISQAYFIHNHDFIIVAGKANNGGDGIVLARYLKNAGARCQLYFPAGVPASDPAKAHLHYFESLGYSFCSQMPVTSASVIIDCLLGAGTKLPLSAELSKITQWMNKQKALKISVDLPTGAASDNGECDACTYRADHTFVLHGYKPSRFLFPAAAFYGQTDIIDIGLPHTSRWKVREADEAASSFTEEHENAHKGTFGHGLLIAGTKTMPGSAALAALGAVSCGAGKLTIQTEKEAVPAIASHVPEAMYKIEDAFGDHDPYDAIAAGCGRASDDRMEKAVQKLLLQTKPVILDAGALSARSYKEKNCPVIVTPHPGEFARMTGKTVEWIQQNRLAEASAYARENGITVILKGEFTVVAFSDGSGFVNPTGNEGLSKGGSGDTLTGIILALVLRSKNLDKAAADAVYLHGLCADLWKNKQSVQTMRPADIHNLIPHAVKKIIKGKNK